MMGVNFTEAARAYLNHAGMELAWSTWSSYKDALRIYWLPALGRVPIRQLKTKHIRQAIRTTEWPTAKTHNNALTVLRQVMRFAVEEYELDDDPAAVIRNRKVQRQEIDAWTPDEVKQIFDGWDGKACAYWLIAFETGARPSELIALVWDDVWTDLCWIDIHQATVRGRAKDTTKNYRARRVLLTAAAVATLARQPASKRTGAVFKNTRGQAYREFRSFNAALRVRLQEAGVRVLSPYHARHTRACHLLMAGASPAWVADQLGHSVQTLLNHYGRWIAGDQARGQDELEKAQSYLA